MTVVDAGTREERVARARAALARAELRTGARSVRTVTAAPVDPSGPTVVADPAPASAGTPEEGSRPAAGRSEELLEHLREHVRDRSWGRSWQETAAAPAPAPVTPSVTPSATPSGAPTALPAAPTPVPTPVPTPGRGSGPRTALLTTERPPLPVPPALDPLLPEGLRRGSTTAVVGSTSLLLALLAQVSAGGAWGAVVGHPTVGLLAAAQAGVVLDRLALVPRPGADGAAVVAALLDGVDVVVVGPGAVLTDADRRRLSARARERGSVLLATTAWTGATVVLGVRDAGWDGVGAGEGHLRSHRVRVVRTGRGGAAVPHALELVLPLPRPGADVVPAPVVVAPAPPVTAPVLEEPAAPAATGALRLVG
ncbi:hypothetical protein [Cellulomonas endophytica]|uniref:hypothetical protein n=1 Tax=Cellulomonas endophytica TaxID=2494735 RepID=UPI001F0CC8CE|nr:hypothetical protein [Cellulomonas endophytica]